MKNLKFVISKNKINNILLFLLFGFIALSMLSPIASSIYLPLGDDICHVGAIIQAKMAIQQGQFPLRVAPWQLNGFMYPFYQFYSPLVYTVAGYIYKLLTPQNPFLAFKLTIWFSIVLGAIYLWRLIVLLLESKSVAILATVVYMLSPYYLININVRGDLTESVAQGIIPIILYYTFANMIKRPDLRTWLFLSISWMALILSHLITFINASFFIALMLILLWVFRSVAFNKICIVGGAYLFGALLAFWFLVPILDLHGILNNAHGLNHIYKSTWLTPFATLLSVAAVSPMPLPGNGKLPINLYASIGWCVLAAFGYLIYHILNKIDCVNPFTKKLSIVLIIIFLVAIFVTWSPINFWKYVPNDINISQFSYRYLTQIMWIGAIIFGIAFFSLFQNKVTASYVVVGILVIGLCSSSWFMTNRSTVTVEQVIDNPDIGYGVGGYLVNPDKVRESYRLYGLSDYLMSDGWLLLDTATEFPTHMFTKNINGKLILQGSLPSWVYHTPVKLFLFINHVKVAEYVLAPGNFSIIVPIAKYIPLHTKHFSLMFKVDKPFVPSKIQPGSTDNRTLAILVSKLAWQANNDYEYMDVEQTKNHCFWSKNKIVCQLPATTAKIFELPVLYYPDLLRVKINGKDISYFPTRYYNLVLVGIKSKLQPKHVSIEFVGISWANWVSAISGISLILLLFISFFLGIKKKDMRSYNGGSS